MGEEQRLQGHQGEDSKWSHKGWPDEEQERQGCEQEGQCKCQEELQEDLWLDHCFQGSEEGTGNQGFLPMWGPDRQGQGIPCKDSCTLQEVKARKAIPITWCVGLATYSSTEIFMAEDIVRT